jgi:FixJ family two-component response regulator
MPESVSGRELAHTLIMDKPDLKVIFTSGYSAELIGTDFEREKQHAFLAKPYLPDRLAQTVATHLQSQPAIVAQDADQSRLAFRE